MMISSRILTVILSLHLACVSDLSAAQAILDLTKHDSQTAIGLPAYVSHSGRSDGLDSLTTFTPKSLLQSVRLGDSGDLVSEITLSNIGAAPLYIPNSFDQKKVFGAGCSGRVELVFTLVMLEKKDQEKRRYPLETTFGSTCDAKSQTVILPAQKLTIKLDQHSVAVQAKSGQSVRIVLQLFRISDNSYAIDGKSALSISNERVVENAVAEP